MRKKSTVKNISKTGGFIEFEKQLSDNENYKNICEYLKKITFKKKFFGGVDEIDVWNKIEILNRIYESALLEERSRYSVLISEYKKSRGLEVVENGEK